ncbi:MAG: glycosyltransferase family 4 protein [Cyanobacteria bacterium P01_G01_bin.39]
MPFNRFAYISFDVVPAPKGAATHIMAFTKAIAEQLGNVDLVTIASPQNTKPLQIHPHVKQTTLPAQGKYLIDRVLYFQRMLLQWQQSQLNNNIQYDVVQIRSIFEGFPLVKNKQKLYRKLVFEVNGLPSVELKYRYSKVAEDRDLLYKLQQQENICLNAANLIVTPSHTTKNYLQNIREVKTEIRVIPNGVDTNIFTYQKLPFMPKNRVDLLYFGTLASWQGVHLAIEALALVNREIPATLSIIGLGRDCQITQLYKLTRKLKIDHLVTIQQPLLQSELVPRIHQSDIVLAPLTANDRNLVQGCCPLKILETMATGTPIIASDLPVVRELGLNNQHFVLVKPGSAKAIKDGVLHLVHNPLLAQTMSINARQQIEDNYTWQQAGNSLIQSYQTLSNTCQLI